MKKQTPRLTREAALERIVERLAMSAPEAPAPMTAKPEMGVVKVEWLRTPPEEVELMTACLPGKGGQFFAQYLLDKLRTVLEARNDEVEGSKVWLLEAFKAILLAQPPKSPLEAMAVARALITHELASDCAAKAVRAEDVSIASKWLTRYTGLAATACQQDEAVRRLRGEAGSQTVRVEHLSVSDGSQAVIGQVSAKPPGG